MTGQQLVPLGNGIEVTPTSLAVTDVDMSFETFEGILASASLLGDSARWWLGDLLLFGESRYGEAYAQAIAAGRVSERQLGRYRYVCQQIARSRRRENLSFSHHEEVAPLEPREQDRLLAAAERGGLSVAELRVRVGDVRALGRASQGGKQRQEILPPSAAVDAARGLSVARATLARIGEGLDPDTAEVAGIPQAVSALEDVARVVRRAADGLSLDEAVARVLDSAVLQQYVADPAYIVPSAPLEALRESYEQARKGAR